MWSYILLHAKPSLGRLVTESCCKFMWPYITIHRTITLMSCNGIMFEVYVTIHISLYWTQNHQGCIVTYSCLKFMHTVPKAKSNFFPTKPSKPQQERNSYLLFVPYHERNCSFVSQRYLATKEIFLYHQITCLKVCLHEINLSIVTVYWDWTQIYSQGVSWGC